MTRRNPKWSRDELIVALDFYHQHSPSIPDKKSEEIRELSEFLNSLQTKLGRDTGDKFRNPNGVYMKLMNFRRFDPACESAGLQRGGKDEEVVWDLFSNNRRELSNVAASIKSLVSSSDPLLPIELLPDDSEAAMEGQVLARTHLYRERNQTLVTRKKQKVLDERGKLSCEVCGFDFSKMYGERGVGFIECHHTRPVSELKSGQPTKLSELALVCSNCHRMIHRHKPWLSIESLTALLAR